MGLPATLRISVALGEPTTGRRRDEARGVPRLRPERRTLQQLLGSILAVLALGAATVLPSASSSPRRSAVIIAALTSG
jgi:hypothetical protein